MNKYLLVLFMVTPLAVSAQFTKGDKFIGGTFRLNSQTPTISNQGTVYRS